jgi:isopentenyldiphosphate isomerase
MNTPVILTDPHELLEIYSPSGEPTGQGATRGDVHLQGLWHCAFYCWVARPGAGEAEILLQHRAWRKDVFPGMFDASAAGHKRLGESMSVAVRELQEELGLTEQLEDLLAIGSHSQVHEHENGLVDREHHALHMLARVVDNAELRPDPLEVQGVAWVAGSAFLGLVDGTLSSVDAEYLAVADDGTVSARRRTILADEIVPYDTGYHQRIVRLANDVLKEKGYL